jgi:spore coat protein CotH
MLKEEFITVDFNLPDHTNELSKAEELIDKYKKRFEIMQMQHSINDCTHTELFEEVVRCLAYIGKLSETRFAIEDELEAMYIKRYKHQPALGKQLWLEHYDEIHHPYTLLKNRCFRLLELLDTEYFEVHGKQPPNYNP